MRKSKNENATHATVYPRITYEGKRAEVSTMRKVALTKWSAKANKVSGSSIEAKQVNRNLDVIKNRIYEIYQKLLEGNVVMCFPCAKYLILDKPEQRE